MGPKKVGSLGSGEGLNFRAQGCRFGQSLILMAYTGAQGRGSKLRGSLGCT